MTEEEIQLAIQQGEKELEKLRQQKVELEELPDTKRLASHLHAVLCNDNHTDRCGWHYENSWNHTEHHRYLKKAEKILAVIGLSEAMEITKFYK